MHFSIRSEARVCLRDRQTFYHTVESVQQLKSVFGKSSASPKTTSTKSFAHKLISIRSASAKLNKPKEPKASLNHESIKHMHFQHISNTENDVQSVGRSVGRLIHAHSTHTHCQVTRTKCKLMALR